MSRTARRRGLQRRKTDDGRWIRRTLERCLRHLSSVVRPPSPRAFSGKVDTGFPQKMRPRKESRARFRFNLIGTRASVPIPKFARVRSTFGCELRNQRDTSKFMILVRFEFEVPRRTRHETDRNFKFTALADDLIEEMAAGTILDLDDPDVGIEAQLARQPFLDLCLRGRLPGDARAEQPIGRARIVERGLRRRTEQLRGAVETVQLDENRAGLLGAAPPHRRKGAFQMAAADIGRDPDCGFEAHGVLQDLSWTEVSGVPLLKPILPDARRGRRPRFALFAGIARGLSSITKPRRKGGMPWRHFGSERSSPPAPLGSHWARQRRRRTIPPAPSGGSSD